jgi:hypothetical protein
VIYAVLAILIVSTWLATRRIRDAGRRTGVAVAVIGLTLAFLMSWMAFPFLVVAAIGALIVGAGYLRERRSA